MLIVMVVALVAVAAPGPLSSQKLDAAERATDPQDKMICKRFVDTGSLVRGTRVCKTKRDWEHDRADIRSGGPGVDSCRDRANGGQC